MPDIEPEAHKIFRLMKESVGDQSYREYLWAVIETQQKYADVFVLLDGDGNLIAGRWLSPSVPKGFLASDLHVVRR